MPTFKPSAKQLTFEEGKAAIPKAVFESFGVKALGLGDIGAPAKATDAIAAMFDLEGFTNFSKQIEPRFSVPLYLNAFLSWLMKEIRDNVVKEQKEKVVLVWAVLPFFVKFMGDGLLVLWAADLMTESARRNILLHARRVCAKYVNEFLPSIGDKIVDAPSRLRCGLAMGTVLSVGNGQDYVGSCINMAARLQKLPGISFCFNRRGFAIENAKTKFFNEEIVVKQVSIRGIGEHELVGVLRTEVEALPSRDRKIYKAV
jgi:class 3 adenylate cyclase